MFIGIANSIGQRWGGGAGFLGLLDSYSGAAAAYSLRQLSSSYSGSAIRVRRASDNTEQDIGFSNNVLDTSTLASFCSGTDGFVTTWYDQSGNGYNATQTTAAYQPQIVSSGTVANILTGGYFSIPNAPITAAPISLAMVANHNSSQIGNMWNANEFGTNTNYIYARSDSNNTFDAAIYGGAFVRSRATLSPGAFLGFGEFLVSGSNITAQAFVNGVGATSVSTTPPTNIDVNDLSIFQRASTATYPLEIKELVIYNSNQSSNRTGIETNINSFYSIY